MLEPNFEKGDGLLPAIVQDEASKEVLMLAYMDREAWRRTLDTGEAHFYSRSRRTLWRKGGSSGHVQRVKGVRLDCDRDTILLLVHQEGGAACHEGYRSCFYRELAGDGTVRECSQKMFDPKEVYK
jgi:phosphoribosyl-AMP cyclohydrolase